MRSTMPQDKPGSLSRAQNADILAHMLHAGGFPAGPMPLDGQAGALSTDHHPDVQALKGRSR